MRNRVFEASRLSAVAIVVSLVFGFPGTSRAQTTESLTQVTVEPDGALIVTADPAATPVVRAMVAAAVVTDVQMRPSVISTPLGRADSRMNFIFKCVDGTGAFVDCTVVINHVAVASSGGHVHHDVDRPKGVFTRTSGSTGGSTGFATTFTAPEVGGVINLLYAGVFPPVPPATTGTPFSNVITIGVEIPGLVSLPAGSWLPYGDIPGQHTDNHYGTLDMNAVVSLVAEAYAANFPSHKLCFNDMSLIQGGLFDVVAPWQTPHASHRFGLDLDISKISNPARNRPECTVPRAHRPWLTSLVRSWGLRLPEGEGTEHLHIRLR